MLLNDSVMEAALLRIAETDSHAAELHVATEARKAQADETHEAIFLREEGSVAERKAKASNSTEYKKAMNDYFEALLAWEKLKNERTRKYAVIECWRSWSSARTKGIIT